MTVQPAITGVEWSERLPVFCSDRFLRTVSGDYGWVEGLDEHGSRQCVLPFCVIRGGGLRLVRFTSETVATGEGLSIDEERAFLNGVVSLFRRRRADLIIPGTFGSLFRTCPDGAIAAPYGTYIVDLCQDESALWQGVHPKHRNKVRTAERRGIRFRVAPDKLQIAARLVEESFERSASGLLGRLRLRWRHRRASIVSEVVSLREDVAVLVAETQDRIHAAAVVPFSEPCAYYMHGGSAADAFPGAMNLLQWEAMKYFKALGVKSYNFVGARLDPKPGSKQEGLVNFKKRFGGSLVRGVMWKYVLDPSKAWIYSLAAMLRSGGDVVDQERHRSWPPTSA